MTSFPWVEKQSGNKTFFLLYPSDSFFLNWLKKCSLDGSFWSGKSQIFGIRAGCEFCSVSQRLCDLDK